MNYQLSLLLCSLCPFHPIPRPGADPGFLRGGGGGGQKFEIMRAKNWNVMVTSSDVMRGGWVQGGASFPPPSSSKRDSFDVSLNY